MYAEPELNPWSLFPVAPTMAELLEMATGLPKKSFAAASEAVSLISAWAVEVMDAVIAIRLRAVVTNVLRNMICYLSLPMSNYALTKMF